ncbi:unnamed protein product [Cuscuta epithymum]|uniref:RNase H type-1 domain-containing protein n=1 Tax=Cuscuta epithymum TaxID=186058 RepID=A0AAV0DE20_9ASTE|nr:unnamed protein product [Cuscuta epithymum]CAH9143865.1 unnamed protein product [Cuscuta epithymum]
MNRECHRSGKHRRLEPPPPGCCHGLENYREIRDVSRAKPLLTKATDPPIFDIQTVKPRVKPKKPTTRIDSWAKPPANFIKINIAMGTRQDGSNISGLVFRDSRGELLYYNSNNHTYPDYTAIFCESMIKSNNKIQDNNYTSIIHESDNLHVIKTLQGTMKPRWTTIANLYAFKETFQYVNFGYSCITKSCNRAAY